MERTIQNPLTPFIAALKVSENTVMKIVGKPSHDSTRFRVNLQTGSGQYPLSRIALHLNPRYETGQRPLIVRNSYVGGYWGYEEREGGALAFAPQAPFEIMILVERLCFKIAVNGMHYCNFNHRVPFDQITHLSICRSVSLDRVGITEPPFAHPPPFFVPTMQNQSYSNQYPLSESPVAYPIPSRPSAPYYGSS